MKTALVHDWLVTYRGGEKVLEALAELYPDAPIYTLFYDPKGMPDSINRRQIVTNPLTNALKRGRKLLLPLLPRAIEAFDLSAYDLIVSSSSCVAKGAMKRAEAKHLCYLHSPMRYIWDQQAQYLQGVSHIPLAAAGIKALTPQLRRWDVASADRVDQFVVNSSFVGGRVRQYYGRDSLVVPPPIELERFVPDVGRKTSAGHLLAAGALVSYKRFDLAIEAVRLSGKKLVIAGSGPMEAALRRQAADLPNVTFVIQPDDATFVQLLQGATALLFPGVEDFGMIAIEAMASGTPVIALRDGGALDFIQPGLTGQFFDHADPSSLAAAIDQAPLGAFDAQALSRYARRYDRQSFHAAIRSQIARLTNGTKGAPA